MHGEQSQRVTSKIVDHDFVALNSLDVDDGIEKTNFPHFDGRFNSGDILSLKANPIQNHQVETLKFIIILFFASKIL